MRQQNPLNESEKNIFLEMNLEAETYLSKAHAADCAEYRERRVPIEKRRAQIERRSTAHRRL